MRKHGAVVFDRGVPAAASRPGDCAHSGREEEKKSACGSRKLITPRCRVSRLGERSSPSEESQGAELLPRPTHSQRAGKNGLSDRVQLSWDSCQSFSSAVHRLSGCIRCPFAHYQVSRRRQPQNRQRSRSGKFFYCSIQ